MKIKRIHVPVFLIHCMFIFLLFPSEVTAQISDRVNSIEITGNKRTRTSYLKRFIETQKGQLFDSIVMENDLRKLRSLSGIMVADYSYVSIDSGISLIYTVKERLTILPVGDFGVSRGNYYIGAGIMESNFIGKGIYLYGFYLYNTNHTVHFIFRNPYLFGSSFGLEMQVKNLPTSDYIDENHYLQNTYFDSRIALKYELKYESDFFLGASYRNETSLPVYNDKTFTDSLIKRSSVVPFIRGQFRKLNCHDFYVSGWRNNVHIESIIPFAGKKQTTLMFYNEFRIYRRIGKKGNAAARFLAGISTENQSEFFPFIADSYYNFRGIGYRAIKGSSIVLINIEYRQTLVENRIGGIQAVLFTDFGKLETKNSSLSRSEDEDEMKLFAGLGIRLIYKKAYNAIFSLDYGLNLRDFPEGGWVIGLGQFF